MTQKAIKVGSSVAVVIPKESLRDLGIKAGDKLRIEVDKKMGKFSVQLAEPVLTDKELISWTRKFIHKYRSALETLADK